ncbi:MULTISPECIES: amino acid transporter [Arthrobacter]|uniref:Amino acid transporter n=1 Tax=Arthrobacter terricola TaxID=2547396 RepID=A0A4R5K869_9MICC|nr:MULTISPECIES: amino acid transporter [Arthrobacter]MBT8161724.1 amino acid transporter [Arthrobacter sp. GN70]TDF89408.1 amino acid transporter [Arthrobacter terricola]
MTTLSRPPADPSAPRPSGMANLRTWLLFGLQDSKGTHQGPGAVSDAHLKKHSWWQVMCLTGVDYFSSLGYAPAIAVLAAGVISPIATLVLVGLTLLGALPVYRRVAGESHRGEGSIAMLERLMPRWTGKLFVLVLLGFAATDFMITMTLSAADATAHLIQNPIAPSWLQGQNVAVTLFLLALLAAVFLRGFKEAIGVAVVLVVLYLGLNVVLVLVTFAQVLAHPAAVTDWWGALSASHGNPLMVVGIALLVFPKLALGMSGFETGVAVMPQIKGAPGDTEDNPVARIKGARRLLTSAAVIMSSFLLATSFITVVLIPEKEFQPGGEADGRALAFLAHQYLGVGFGTVYDLSTITILWFAGASAMAGLLNLVPRYLPRYGMAPEWAKAVRPLVLVFTIIGFLITFLFNADVDAQGGAYATGVLVLMTSAAVAVTLSARRARQRKRTIGFGLIAVVFIYTTIANMFERPEGLRIAAIFIAGIILISLLSRIMRSFELHASHVRLDRQALEFLTDVQDGPLAVISHEPLRISREAYRDKLNSAIEVSHLPLDQEALFLEVIVDDSSDFETELDVRGVNRHGYRVLEVHGPVVPNTIASVLLHIRDVTGLMPHIYFRWTEGNPIINLLKFLFLGEGEIAPVTREVLREAEPEVTRRPWVHVG